MLLNCVSDKSLDSPLDSQEIKPVNSKGNQLWRFIGRTDDEAEAPVLWPPDAKNWLIGKDPDAGKDRRQKEKGMTEDEMVEGHHWLDGHEFKQALGDGDWQGSLACCSPWVTKSGKQLSYWITTTYKLKFKSWNCFWILIADHARGSGSDWKQRKSLRNL